MHGPVITMVNLKLHAKRLGISGPMIAAIADIPIKRFHMLDSRNAKIAEEPYLWEAAAVASVLGLPGIVPLLTSGDLTDLDLGYDARDDLDVWLADVKLPLVTACRLALRFGYDDPIHIWRIAKAPSVDRQRMLMLASGERTGGMCPWCNSSLVGGAAHVPTCSMQLWLPRDRGLADIGAPPRPRKPGVRRLGDSHKAPGLKALRERLGYTQAVMAGSLGMNTNYYARLERCDFPLTSTLAETICALYKVQLHDIFSAPGAGE